MAHTHFYLVLISRWVQLTYTVVNEMNEMSENNVSQKVKYVLKQLLPFLQT